jgi:LysR family glycine cleavage system transcriptional activator
MTKLPPLNALRAFEAAGRHQSFSRAADELCVTHGAVSRHIKLLEADVGVSLFHRRAQGIELTRAGRSLLPEISAALERMTSAVGMVASRQRELKVICACTLANRWLVPQLPRFREHHPDISVSVGLFHSGYSDFYAGNYDLGIDCHVESNRRPPELEAELIRREALTPVCAPSLLGSGPSLRDPNDLATHNLLHPVHETTDWQNWLSAADAKKVDGTSGQTFATMEMAIKAAEAGLGVAICDRFFIEDELASGRLVAPFDLVVRDNTGYYLFAERGRMSEPAIAAFRNWIVAEIHRSPVNATGDAGGTDRAA